MKILLRYFCILTIFIFVGTAFTAYAFFKDVVMSAAEVKAKWGSEKADYKKFKDSSYENKSKMAYSIMTDKSLIGKSYEEIREIFGSNDGHYFNDTTPAYIIKEGKNHSEDTWQIVFKMNNEYKVREIIMHKNCCNR